jgi:putative DNA primase/helicase
LNLENIKAIVAGDRIPARGPYSLPIEFEPYAKHFFAMNEYPQISDNTYGTWRRIYIIEFPRIFAEEEADKMLIDKLLLELPGIFNWAMEGYRRLKKNGFVFHASEAMRKSKEDLKEKTDSIYSFIEHCLAKDPNGRMKFSDLYQIYVDYSHNESFALIQSKMKLSNRLVKEGYQVINDSSQNNQKFVYGISLKNRNGILTMTNIPDVFIDEKDEVVIVNNPALNKGIVIY